MRRSHFFVESSRFFSSISVWSFTSAAVRSVLRKQIAGLKLGGARIEAPADASSQKCSQSGDGVDHDGAVHARGHAKIRRNGDP